MLMGKQLPGRRRMSSRHGDAGAPPGHPHLGYKTSPEIGGGETGMGIGSFKPLLGRF